jgi:hypothetical protein
MTPVLNATDISAYSSSQVAAIFNSTIQLLSPQLKHRDGVTLFNKFLVVASFMDFSLTKISEELTKGYFSVLSSKELGGLVEATFDESEKRTRVLKSLD